MSETSATQGMRLEWSGRVGTHDVALFQLEDCMWVAHASRPDEDGFVGRKGHSPYAVLVDIGHDIGAREARES